MAPRLQRAADLAVHARLRQRNARFRCHLGNDRHVVFGQAIVWLPHFSSGPFAQLDMRSARRKASTSAP